MRLYLLEPLSRIGINISAFCNKYNIIREITTDSRNYNQLVIIGNGSPDEIVITTICSAMNGDVTSVIVKPKVQRYGILDILPVYLGLKNINNILFIMDQEDDGINQAFDIISKKLREKGFGLVEDVSEKLKIFNGSFGGREFTLIVVLSGLDDIPTEKHCIEDHLISAGNILCRDNSSKLTWRSVDNGQQSTIYRRLLQSNARTLSGPFPQQIEAFHAFLN